MSRKGRAAASRQLAISVPASHGMCPNTATAATNGTADGSRYRIATEMGTAKTEASSRPSTIAWTGVRVTSIGKSTKSLRFGDPWVQKFNGAK
ncbi:MAG: hypothetical protein HZB38_15275 [Planctomycetes bacterium]|nr:hypothetical protein [Planctomycetota bacterium]